MKYHAINSKIFIKNRRNFVSAMKSNSLAIFNSNDVYSISSNSRLPFEQNSDFIYLSGIIQEESVLFLFPDCPIENHREILFIKETNRHILKWEGAKLNKESAYKISGIKTVCWLKDLEKILLKLSSYADTFYLNANENYRPGLRIETREDRFRKWLLEKHPTHSEAKSSHILQKLRSVKAPLEIELIQHACDITEKGFRRILPIIKPGVWEFEIEAEMLCEFVKNRSKGFAYPPIIASGKNSNILHYSQNNQQCKADELVLIDAASEYANYKSDLTRTIPVSGRFNKRQKAVYEAVNHVKKEATKMLLKGTSWKEYNYEVGKLMTLELLKLGLIDKADIQQEGKNLQAYKKYFVHGVSHHIGLDTHDCSFTDDTIKANMVLSVEPGIYIRRENFGVRIEDIVVIQEEGEPFNLMRNVPVEIEEIEDLIN